MGKLNLIKIIFLLYRNLNNFQCKSFYCILISKILIERFFQDLKLLFQLLDILLLIISEYNENHCVCKMNPLMILNILQLEKTKI